MIDRGTVDRIYAAANIVEVVGDFISLRKKGINYQACCPFHNEKTPSFVVSPAKGLFKCFGCGKGGNSVTFVMEHEGISYVEALKYVAKKYGIEVQERELSPEEVRKNDDRESMMVVSSYASDWFRETLNDTDEGRNIGLSYFRERGFSDTTIERFRLGYCPTAGDTFTQAALAAGYKEEFLIGTGLSGKRESDGRYYDRFFGRVIFPIHSVSGRVVGFGGRTLRTDKKVAKYLNSPESEIYHKSNILYGLFFAKKAIGQEDNCILVEGYTDVISMHQSGVENVVASSGTSLTTEQIRLIGRFTRNVTVIYDGDAAGIHASLRGIDMILREGMNVRVVPLPDGEDPDSFARSHSASQVREYIKANEEDFIAFKTRSLLTGSENDPIRRAELISDIVASIAEVPDPIMRSLYTKETAAKMEMDFQLLTSEVARKRISHGSDEQTRTFIRNQQEQQRDERRRIENLAGMKGVEAGSSIDELEKELVKYLIKYGHRNFKYKEGKAFIELNVSEIIISDLEANGLTFRNPRYRALYETYVQLRNGQYEAETYEETTEDDETLWNDDHADLQQAKAGHSVPQYEMGDGSKAPQNKNTGHDATKEVGLHHFINHPDPEVCNAAVDILTDSDNYAVSKMWQKFDVVIESELDKLAENVPRAVILYKSKAIESIIDSLQEQLRDENLPDDELLDITHRIAALNRERMSIARKLSRLIL